MFTYLKHLKWKASLLTTAISLLAVTIAMAASGDLDTTFDSDGLVNTNIIAANPMRTDYAQGIALQPDGKIIAAGFSAGSAIMIQDFAVIRYNTDGSLDTTFSGDGKLLTNFGGRDEARGVAVQSNGKIVVAGMQCNSGLCDVALARYNPGGALDTTFSGDGKQTTDFGTDTNWASGLAIQSNGRIVVSGFVLKLTGPDFAVYRYLSNGSLDISFGGDGKVGIGFGAWQADESADLAIQTDGKIVIAGETFHDFTNHNFAIARLNANGTLDNTFSGDGKLVTNMGADDHALSLALQPDGKILLAGYSCDPNGQNCLFALVRYNTNGSLDTTFNGTGRKRFRVMAVIDSYASDVIVQPDGKIVVLGWTYDGVASDFALVRLNSDGSFDTTFSGDGKVIVDFGDGQAYGRALALQPLDGKYVLCGAAVVDTPSYDFACARVLP